MGPGLPDLPAAERSNCDDDLQGAMMDLLRQQQRTMEALTKELTTRARLEQNRALGPSPQQQPPRRSLGGWNSRVWRHRLR